MSLKNFIEDIQRIKKCYDEKKSDMELIVANQLHAFIKERVFDRTQGTDGEYFGQYRSKDYIKKRADKGLQIQYKDLQFSRELSKDLQVGIIGDKQVLGFSQKRSEDIVIGQENGSTSSVGFPVKQIGFSIFAPSDEEIDNVIENQLGKEWNKIVQDCIA